MKFLVVVFAALFTCSIALAEDKPAYITQPSNAERAYFGTCVGLTVVSAGLITAFTITENQGKTGESNHLLAAGLIGMGVSMAAVTIGAVIWSKQSEQTRNREGQ
jgi:tellurite resistance protein TehA-like permease